MRSVLSPLLLSFLFACGGPGTPASKVDQAVAVARDLRARPAEPEKVLADHNLSADQWETLMFEIADDPTLAAKYASELDK
jgi:hypothetical protein